MELGARPWYTLGVYAKFLEQSGVTGAEARRKIEEFLIRCEPTTNLVRWQNTIDAVTKYATGKKLINIDGIAVTRAEMEWIQRAGSLAQQKLLFTMLCLAKYHEMLNDKNGGWINTDISDTFKMANIQLSRKRQGMLINTLLEKQYIELSRRVNNNNIKVLYPRIESETIIVITDFRNIGNQYMNHIGGGYMMCAECGIVVKKTGNRHRYCKACAERINRMNTLANYRHIAQN